MNLLDNPLKETRKKGVLLAAHRGTNGGNIIQNTIPAYENALKHYADILEVDVARTTDGKFFVFHTGQEPGLLGTDQRLDAMSTEQVQGYRLTNSMQEITSQKIDTLDDVLEHFKGKCMINIDRSWFYWKDIIRYLQDKCMNDQIILKSPPERQLLKILEDSRTGIMYMPIVREHGQLEQVFLHKNNFTAAEIIFPTDSHELAQAYFIEEMHKKGILLWVNAITIDDQTVLSGGHDDNCAILKNMNDGWGWLIEQGFDIIQTDWPMLLKSYMAQYHETQKR